MSMLVGFDLGGTQIKAGAYSDSGDELARATAPTEDAPGTGKTPRFAEHVKRILSELERTCGTPATAVGISAPGLADRNERSIASMPGRMHGLEGFDWSDWLERPAPVLNDAHAALLGEVWRGAGTGLQDAILLTLGTGVGGAIWSGGRLLRGAIGRAGHFGHLCLDPFGAPTIARMPGGLEDWIGNHNIVARTGGRFATTHDLVAACEQGDPFAREVWDRSVRALGCGIASLVNILDPEAVIIGGGIARAGDTLFTPVSRVLAETEWRPGGHCVKVLPAQLGEWAGTYGAAWHAHRSIS